MNKVFVNNIGDLGEIQRASFFRFLYSGIGEELKQLPNPFFAKLPIYYDVLIDNVPRKIETKLAVLVYLYLNEIKFGGPYSDIETCHARDLTYSIFVYIPSSYTYDFTNSELILHDHVNSGPKRAAGRSKKGQILLKDVNHHKEHDQEFTTVVLKEDLLLAEIPLITGEGTFIVNGCERIVVSQIIRSPGIYFRKDYGRTIDKTKYRATIISNKGFWTNVILDTNKIDQKLRIYIQLKEIKLERGLSQVLKNSQKLEKEGDHDKLFVYDIIKYFGLGFQELWDMIEDKDLVSSLQIQGERLEPDPELELPENYKMPYLKTANEIATLLNDVFYNSRSGRFSMGEIGRYKINKTFGLNFPKSLTYLTALDFIGIINGLLALKKDTRINDDIDDIKNKIIRSVGELLQNHIRTGIFQLRKKLKQESDSMESKIREIRHVDTEYPYEDYLTLFQKYKKTNKRNPRGKTKTLNKKNLFQEPSFPFSNFFNFLENEKNHVSDPKSKSLENQIYSKKNRRILNAGAPDPGMLEFIVFSNKNRKFIEITTGQKHLLTSLLLTNLIRQFFTTSELSQFMDQTNPLAELTHKRRISVFGPNGLKRDHISTVIRDIHPSQYGRLCPVETPEGQNAGLITALALFGRVNPLRSLETPYFFMNHGEIYSKKEPIYLDSIQELNTPIALSTFTALKNFDLGVEGIHGDIPALSKNMNFMGDGRKDCSSLGQIQEQKLKHEKKQIFKSLLSVKENYLFSLKKLEDINFITISPLQIISVATALIPFVEHDDANRALMGANMQRQAVPLLYTQKPIVGTGLESAAVLDSGLVIKSYCEGTVMFASSREIEIKDHAHQSIRYFLRKYGRSNQETAINQKPLVWLNEKVFAGQVIADGPGSTDGELSLGRNLLIAYMPWEGFNYEDAIVISERIILEDCLTSIHIEDFDLNVHSILRDDQITRKIPHEKAACGNLDRRGIIKIGSYVREDDILIGKRTLTEEESLTGEKKLIRAMLETTKNSGPSYRNTSLKVQSGIQGRVIAVQVVYRGPSPSDRKVAKSATGGEIYSLKSATNSNTKKWSTENEEKEGNPQKAPKSAKASKNSKIPKISKNIKSIENENNKTSKEIEGVFQKPFKKGQKKREIKLIRVSVAQIRKVQVGDKLAGRHGNKGIISRILSTNDMPYLPDGTPVDIIFNPLGVPSRMNVGQIFECLLGFAGEKLGSRFKVTPFDEMYGKEASRVLVNQKLKEAALTSNCSWIFNSRYPGKMLLRDGRTGDYFDNPITVGKSYILKLIHLVEDKIHTRSIGPYSMITEQPLAGKSQNGGQRFGEMEVWALEAYGCSNTLQELLTVKSDDIDGRTDMYESISVRKEVPKPTPGIPESFLALIRELNALGLDFSLNKTNLISPSKKEDSPDTFQNFEPKIFELDIFKDLETRLKLRALLVRYKVEEYSKLDQEDLENQKRIAEKTQEKKKIQSILGLRS